MKEQILEPQKIFASQFDPKIEAPESVRRTMCGIASLSMAIHNVTKEKPDINRILQEFTRDGKYTHPRVVVTFNQEDSREQTYPVYTFDPKKSDTEAMQEANQLMERLDIKDTKWRLDIDKKVNAEGEYVPTFLLDRGTDMRGMLEYVKKIGLKGLMVEFSENPKTKNKTESHIEMSNSQHFLDTFEKLVRGDSVELNGQQICLDEHSSIVASISMEALEYPDKIKYVADPKLPSTHLVAVLPARGNGILYMDPTMTSAQEGTQVGSLEFFKKALYPNENHIAHFLVVYK